MVLLPNQNDKRYRKKLKKTRKPNAKVTTKILTYKDLSINVSEIYEAMGYVDVLPDKRVTTETENIITEVSQWLRPQFAYIVVSQLPAFHLGTIIEKQLCGADAYAIFVATAGREFEDFQQRLSQQGDMLKVFIVNTLGSLIAEKCADEMERYLQTSIDKLEWKHTNRFSPGYCGWSLTEQHELFSLFPSPTPCGISLTDSSLMVPIKSVSGIIGVGKSVSKQEYSCGRCDFDKCYKKKKTPKAPHPPKGGGC